MKIDGSKLMSCGATADGGGVQLHLADAAGEPVTLILPLALARSVATVLPQLLTFALKVRTGDDSACHVFEAQTWRLDAAAESRVIITLGSPDGFEVSYCMPRQECQALSLALGADDEGAPTAPAPSIN